MARDCRPPSSWTVEVHPGHHKPAGEAVAVPVPDLALEPLWFVARRSSSRRRSAICSLQRKPGVQTHGEQGAMLGLEILEEGGLLAVYTRSPRGQHRGSAPSRAN